MPSNKGQTRKAIHIKFLFLFVEFAEGRGSELPKEEKEKSGSRL